MKKVKRIKPNLRKGDTVVVLSGKDRGEEGKILQVDVEKQRVLVENVNIVKKHQRAGGKIQQAGIIEKPAFLHWSKVQLICPACGKPTRVKREKREDGFSHRVCRKCGEIVEQVG